MRQSVKVAEIVGVLVLRSEREALTPVSVVRWVPSFDLRWVGAVDILDMYIFRRFEIVTKANVCYGQRGQHWGPEQGL
jgi:hypothetical protein